MYKQLRNYIWGFDTVQRLADLEIAVYESFPDVNKIQGAFNQLYVDIQSTLKEDEELAKSVDSFKEAIQSIEGDFYLKLGKVQEAI